jgi:hypothetical protein
MRLESYNNVEAGRRQVLLRNPLATGMRRIRVSCEVRKLSGSGHILHIGWRLAANETPLNDPDLRIPVESRSWIQVNEYLDIDPNKECFLRIDDYYEAGQTPSEVQIRSIVIAERKLDD